MFDQNQIYQIGQDIKMSSSSTATCGGNNEMRGVHNANEKKLLLGGSKLLVPGNGRRSVQSNNIQVFRRDDFNAINLVQTPPRVMTDAAKVAPRPMMPNGEISKIHRNSTTLSPLMEFLGPTSTDPSNMITANMTTKDRERRAALLADSPELPSKPPFQRYVSTYAQLY